MPEREGDIHAAVASLEENLTLLVERLRECRQENDMLRSELSSLQDILRRHKLPVTDLPSRTGDDGGKVHYAEKVQIKQKLVSMLQKIDLELRNDQTL